MAQVMATTGLTSEANVLRQAMVCFARHLGLRLSVDAFAIRSHGGNRRTRRAKPTEKAIGGTRQGSHPPVRRQPDTHVWRQS